MNDLGTMGGHYSYAKSINNKNQIVGGSFIDDADSIYHAFISDGVNMIDLNSKVTSKAANWVLGEGTGINDKGTIVGTGTLLGDKHGFMLVPLAPGDANADGKIDFADLVVVAQNYGDAAADWEHGDFNDDTTVGFADLVAIAQNYGTGSAAQAQFAADVQSAFASVPEPGGIFIVMAVGCVAAGRRRSRA
jgi:probable HAF family extracellular repeat protein